MGSNSALIAPRYTFAIVDPFVEDYFAVFSCLYMCLDCVRVIIEPAACRIVTADDVKSLKSKLVSHKSTRCAGIAQLKKFVARSGTLSIFFPLPNETRSFVLYGGVTQK